MFISAAIAILYPLLVELKGTRFVGKYVKYLYSWSGSLSEPN